MILQPAFGNADEVAYASFIRRDATRLNQSRHAPHNRDNERAADTAVEI